MGGSLNPAAAEVKLLLTAEPVSPETGDWNLELGYFTFLMLVNKFVS